MPFVNRLKNKNSILLEFFFFPCYNIPMQIDLSKLISNNQTVAVALSGGGDSMALLHYMLNESKKYQISIIAINIEHGIRGEDSISDTNFVKNYCTKIGVPLLTYSVDAVAYSKEHGLSLEQAGRILRYQIFNDAITQGKCDKVATAHHQKDNFESVLFNLFRGSGLKGLAGIDQNFDDKIIRPLLSVSKQEILDYLSKNNIPYVIDQTNFDDKYTRNAIRLNILPEIEKVFPEAEKSVYRFSQIARLEDDYITEQTLKALTFLDKKVLVALPIHNALLSRATVLALKHLGVIKDWEKSHVDSVIALAQLDNGKMADLPKGVIAVKEYDKIVFYKDVMSTDEIIPFSLGEIYFDNKALSIKSADKVIDIKKGFFADKDKIPAGAVIRTRRDNDKFTKFGGGTKSLSDYFTDKKIPLIKRDSIPLLAVDSDVLAIFGIAISDKIKVDENTKTIIELK